GHLIIEIREGIITSIGLSFLRMSENLFQLPMGLFLNSVDESDATSGLGNMLLLHFFEIIKSWYLAFRLLKTPKIGLWPKILLRLGPEIDRLGRRQCDEKEATHCHEFLHR